MNSTKTRRFIAALTLVLTFGMFSATPSQAFFFDFDLGLMDRLPERRVTSIFERIGSFFSGLVTDVTGWSGTTGNETSADG